MKLADELKGIQAKARKEREKLEQFLKDLPDWFRSLAESEKKPTENGYLLIADTKTEWTNESLIKIDKWLQDEGIRQSIIKEGGQDKPTYPMYVTW